VYDEDGTTKIPASSPQPLTETGQLKYPGGPGLPELLQRRLNPIIDFAPFFGTPPP